MYRRVGDRRRRQPTTTTVRRRRPGPTCKKAPGRAARHQVLNDIILRASNAADVPAVKEPSGLNRQDGLSLIPWQSGKPILLHATVASTLTGSYVDTAATGAGLVADQAADRKKANTTISEHSVFFSRCQLKHWVHSAFLHWTF